MRPRFTIICISKSETVRFGEPSEVFWAVGIILYTHCCLESMTTIASVELAYPQKVDPKISETAILHTTGELDVPFCMPAQFTVSVSLSIIVLVIKLQMLLKSCSLLLFQLHFCKSYLCLRISSFVLPPTRRPVVSHLLFVLLRFRTRCEMRLLFTQLVPRKISGTGDYATQDYLSLVIWFPTNVHDFGKYRGTDIFLIGKVCIYLTYVLKESQSSSITLGYFSFLLGTTQSPIMTRGPLHITVSILGTT